VHSRDRRDAYTMSFVGQSPRSGGLTVYRGQVLDMSIAWRNTGQATWYRTGRYHLRAGLETHKSGGNWTYWDLTPGQMGWQPYDRWFDFPDISCSVDYLYGTTNVFNIADQGLGCDIWRVSLDDLAAGQWTSGYYHEYDGRKHVRLMKGRDSTMYGGCWAYDGAINFFNWGDWSTDISWQVCPVAPFTYLTKHEGHAVAPDGTDWADFADGRILGAGVPTASLDSCGDVCRT